nr:hypothetical protein [Sedimentibacter sp.]
MNNKNNNYRVMKFLEPVNKTDKSKGYVRLDIRGIRGTIIVSVENLGDSKTTSEVYLYKDKNNKIKVGTVNNKKGMIKKTISIANNSTNFEDYNICGVVRNNKIVLYANLFNAANVNDIRKLEENIHVNNVEDIQKDENNTDNSNGIANNELEEYEESKGTEESNEMGESKEIEEAEEPKEKIDNAKGEEEYEDEAKSVETEKLETKIDENNEQEQESIEAATKKVVYKSKFEENLYNLLREYSKINPLSVDIKSMSWWKIPFDDRGVKNGFLPYYDQIISSYYPYPMSNRVTTCHSLMRKYGYYLFGIYRDNNKNIKKFVYGVPGEFKREEQPYKGITGFKNWSYKNKEINGDYGFWLAFVDSNTGEVSEPPQIVG